MKINQIMSKKVEYVEPKRPIGKAAEKMRDLNIGFLPICENDKLVGTVTDRDITIRSVPHGRDPRLTPVSEIMTQALFYCYEDADRERIAQYMQAKVVRRMVT